ncbi:sodium/nucleoside cotransporter 2 [Biomphalaria pfeifferi]|uniref:Sodium/nucleoside cotransporter n=1 Tax=Biomphalaria pfeifferi TaxID=112525 RepID=A0AAD8ATF4_BIOPF|nr:sodium/nucleoside cotransporter 2 [Biomphalaria pfeifferi]
MSDHHNGQVSQMDVLEIKQLSSVDEMVTIESDLVTDVMICNGATSNGEIKTSKNISTEDVAGDEIADRMTSLAEENESPLSLAEFFLERFGSKLTKAFTVALLILYFTYFIGAILFSTLGSCYQEQDIMDLVQLTVVVSVLVVSFYSKEKLIGWIQKVLIPIQNFVENNSTIFKRLIVFGLVGTTVVIIIISAVNRPSNLISIIGWGILLSTLIICSHAPRKIKWRPVVGGFFLQFFMATLVLKWELGFKLFEMLGSLFTKFMNYSLHGAVFVFGSTTQHFFAFQVLPVIVFFSTIITLLYYLGIMQVIIEKIAWFMKFTVGTTGAESLCAAGNIFVGATEAPIMIRPFLADMTNSELHAVMVGGFATIAGGVMAAYIMNGVPAAYLITASVMNAPASLAVSKVIHPELSKSKIASIRSIMQEKQPYNNLLHAAASGASAAISLVANIAANLIAFVSLLYIANAVVSWFGSFVCLPELNFEMICGYVLRPLVFTMGVEWQDTGHVAELIGIKTFINEFVAYSKLADMIKSRQQCLQGEVLSVRSEIIATFALCGFANFGCIGVQLGGLGPMAPSRLVDMTKLAISAMFGGLVTNLMSACLAGLLIDDMFSNTTSCNLTTALTNTTF